MGKGDGENGWTEYFRAMSDAAGYDTSSRGWKAAMARAMGVGDAQVGRWEVTERKPEIDSCKLLAQVWGVPLLDVLIAAGHVDPAEVNMTGRPETPKRKPLTPELARLARLLENPETPDSVRETIQRMLTAAADLGESSASAERPPA